MVNQRGITRIALVVTIIVLLILAGVGIAMLTGENSIIRKAIEAKEATNEAEAKERVQLEVLGSLDNKGNIDKEQLKDNLKDNLGVQDNQIIDPNEGDEFEDPFDFPLGDFDIEVKPDGTVEVLPKGEVPTPPTLSEGDITYTVTPSTLTNKEVKVTIKVSTSVSSMRLTLQYATEEPDEETSWQTYSGAITFEDNGPIYARLINENGEKSNYTTRNVTNIDKVNPTITEFKAVEGTTTTNGVQVTVTASDDRQLASKDTYKFFAKEEGTEEYKLNGSSTESTYTYTNLTQGKNYSLKVIVTDEAGNTEEKEYEEQITTNKVPDLNYGEETVPSPGETEVPTPTEGATESPDPSLPQKANITFKYSNTEWNHDESVKVTLQLSEDLTSSGFKLEYQTLNEINKEWQEYTEAGFDITQNGSIFARLVDSSNQSGGTATSIYNKFDRKAPTITIETEEPDVASVKVNVTSSEDTESALNAKDASGLVDENKYTYTVEAVDGDEVIYPYIADEETHTFDGLTQGKQYKVKVTVKDKAGNIGTSNEETITTKTIPVLTPTEPSKPEQQGNITFEYTPETWTNQNVNVKVTSDLLGTYKLLYSLNYNESSPTEATWEEYTDEGFDIPSNQKFAVKLSLKSGTADPQYSEVLVQEVTWIDRKAPELTIDDTPTTTNSITVNVTASDDLAGLKEETPISYYLIEGEVTNPEQRQTEKGEVKTPPTTATTYTYTGLTQATTYTIVVEAEDKAGNVSTQSKVVTTAKVPDLSYGTDITYTYSPSTWTNTPPVTVTMNPLNNVDEGFTLQYGTSTIEAEPTTWTDYTSEGFTVSENCTVYARLKEKDGNQTGNPAQNTLNLIDTEDPTASLAVTSYTTNSLTVKTTASEATPQSGLHTTETYAYEIYQGSAATGSALQNKEASTSDTATFTGLTQGETYTVKVTVKDNAGNTTEATSEPQTLKQVPNLEAGDITFEYDTKTWTNKASVKVTLTTTGNVDLDTYKLQYSTDYKPEGQTGSWEDYTDAGFEITENGTQYARLIEKEGTQTGGTATSTYSYFDRTAPTATLSLTKTSNSITATAGYEGEGAGESGLAESPYTYYLYAGTDTSASALQTKEASASTTATFENLTQGTQYTVKVEVRDKATNKGEKTETETTEAISSLATEFTFSYSPAGPNWTSSDVIVTATPNYLDNANYKLQMKTDSKTTWTDYTAEGYTVSTNEKVYAQLIEKNGTQTSAEQAEGEVTWIDKEAPTLDTLEIETNVIVGYTTIDVTNIGATDTQSGIKQFEFFIAEDSESYPSSGTVVSKNEVGSSSKVTASNTFTTEEGTTYKIKVVVTDNAGNTEQKELTGLTTKSSGISETTSYVGYYADLDGNGTPDGLIYADLAVPVSGDWEDERYPSSTGIYEYGKTSGLKKYEVSTTNESGFGNISKPMVSEVIGTSGNDRFYVMALSNLGDNRLYWYYSAYDAFKSNATPVVDYNINDFGTGKAKTSEWISAYNDDTYGEKNSNDMWNVIQNSLTQYTKTWFIASKSEWASFGGNLGISLRNVGNFELDQGYWSSSLYFYGKAWLARFKGYSDMDNHPVNLTEWGYVRLSTTF